MKELIISIWTSVVKWQLTFHHWENSETNDVAWYWVVTGIEMGDETTHEYHMEKLETNIK